MRSDRVQRLTLGRLIGNVLAMAALFAASVLPDSWLGDGLSVAGGIYIAIFFVLRVRTGYLHRRPHWTRESWTRFLAALSVPVVALLISVAMGSVVERRLPIAGATNSSVRGYWAAGIMGFMVVGVTGLAVAIEWLATGQPSRQLGRPAWLTRRRGQ